MKETFYKGAAGNLSLHLVTVSLAAIAVNSSVIAVDGLPIGTQITGIRVVTDALGAGTEVTAKVVTHGGDETSLAAFDTVAAGNAAEFVKPVYVGDEGPSDLVL